MIDKNAFCFQGEIRSVTGPLDNSSKVEVKIDLGTRVDHNIGELRFRVVAAEQPLFVVGQRYSVSVAPVERED